MRRRARRQASLLLEIAAVIGRDVSPDLLLLVAAADGISAAGAQELIARLIRRRLVRRPGPAGLQFTQALLRDTAYGFTPKARREPWHSQLAGHLAAAPGAAAAGDALAFAHHAEAACLLSRELRPGDVRYL
jgi:predicted ATPase